LTKRASSSWHYGT